MKLTATMLRKIINEEVAAVHNKRRLAEAKKVEISAEEYKLFKALLAKHPELAGDVEASEAPARKAMDALNAAMKNPLKKATVDNFFDPDRGAMYYWDGGNKFVFEILYDDVTGHSWGCRVTPELATKAGFGSLAEFKDFLDSRDVRELDEPDMLCSPVAVKLGLTYSRD